MFRKIIFLLMAISLLVTACAPGNSEIILPADSPETIANGGQPVFVQPAGCSEPESDPMLDPNYMVSICQPNYIGNVDVIDAAMVITAATPWPGDEEIVFIVWAGKTIVKIGLVAGSAYLTAHSIQAVSFNIAPEYDQEEMSLALSTAAITGRFAIMADGTEVSPEAYRASGLTNNCTPLSPEDLCKHVISDGEKAKIASRIQAATESIGKPIVQCLSRVAAEGSSNAVVLVMEVAFRGATSGSSYKGVSFLFNQDVPDRSTFMSLKRLKDGQLPGFTETPMGDPRCTAAIEFMKVMQQVLSGY